MAEAEASRVRNGYNSNGSGPRPAQTARECSYSKSLKCKPLDFKGTEGVVGLLDTTTPEAAHAMPWAALKKMMTDKYCPRGEIKKIETEIVEFFRKRLDKIEKVYRWNADIETWQCKASNRRHARVIEFTTELMEDKTQAYAEHQAERKRKYDDLSKNNQNQQSKRQNKAKSLHVQANIEGNNTGSKLYVPV
ncbi:hypothetical protein Tco_0774574 [Tanacetum coccineum]